MRSCVALLVLLALPRPALADAAGDKLAHAYLLTARDAFQKGHIEEALNQFTEAYRASGRPAFHYNIGICLERLGRTEEAIAAFQRYLAEEPHPTDARSVRERIETLRAKLRAQRPPATPAASPPTPAASPPTPAAPPPTPAAPPAASPTGAVAAPPSPAPAAAVALEPEPLTVRPATHTPIYKKWWLWTAVGAAAVAVAVGVGVGAALTPNDAPVPANAYSVRFH
jgi:tetratricopeptide (TPR) repeat protein